jgi:hypothetical protein
LSESVLRRPSNNSVAGDLSREPISALEMMVSRRCEAQRRLLDNFGSLTFCMRCARKRLARAAGSVAPSRDVGKRVEY